MVSVGGKARSGGPGSRSHALLSNGGCPMGAVQMGGVKTPAHVTSGFPASCPHRRQSHGAMPRGRKSWLSAVILGLDPTACTHPEHDRRGMPERHARNSASKSVRFYTEATGAHEARKRGASRGIGTSDRAKRPKNLFASCAPVAFVSSVLQPCLSGRRPHHQDVPAGGTWVRADPGYVTLTGLDPRIGGPSRDGDAGGLPHGH